MSGLDSELQNIVKSSKSEADIVKALQALAFNGKQHQSLFKEIILSDKSFTLRQTAFTALLKSDAVSASGLFADYLAKLSGADKKNALEVFSGSASGSKLLLNSIESGKLTSADFDMSMAERIFSFNKKNKAAKELFTVHKKIEAAEEKAFKGKLEKFMKIASKRGGDPAMGKSFFNALCLSCHSVGSEGAGFAPPLDGSSHREDEALLTAILNPDAAVESNYYLYRLIKKDGSTLEGYREKSDEDGTTMRFMGGASVFIPASDIQSGNFVGKRSVMPKGLIDNLGEKQIADVLAYIRSLK